VTFGLTVELTGVSPSSAQRIDRLLEAGMRASTSYLVGQVSLLVRDRRYDTGALGQSITDRLTRPSQGAWLGEVYSPLVYAPVMEFGRRPGARMPPIDPIQRWVRRKLGLRSSEARGVAFVIARSIGRRGIPGAFFFRDAAARSEPALQRIWDGVVARIVAEVG
jgi:hypothetical protein